MNLVIFDVGFVGHSVEEGVFRCADDVVQLAEEVVRERSYGL